MNSFFSFINKYFCCCYPEVYENCMVNSDGSIYYSYSDVWQVGGDSESSYESTELSFEDFPSSCGSSILPLGYEPDMSVHCDKQHLGYESDVSVHCDKQTWGYEPDTSEQHYELPTICEPIVLDNNLVAEKRTYEGFQDNIFISPLKRGIAIELSCISSVSEDSNMEVIDDII